MDVYKNMAGIKELPGKVVRDGGKGVYVHKQGDRAITLREFASSSKDSGQVWTIGVEKWGGKNGFRELKFRS
ncbi:MAG: hypothetical protein OWQ56_06450 [Acidithiobacillus caldus]|nr:hypothetical protein [Acidithiobacillus caldus]